ncbi:hypothetical protein [Streptomyces sp. CS227]|uniref:hypothetical protein n=1 Tax=Streptomyces sp. CS227 TaxID=1982763 RepID=UPI00117DDD99|nr:hypothetical protein [Streptomyces sp. CS227]
MPLTDRPQSPAGLSLRPGSGSTHRFKTASIAGLAGIRLSFADLPTVTASVKDGLSRRPGCGVRGAFAG